MRSLSSRVRFRRSAALAAAGLGVAIAPAAFAKEQYHFNIASLDFGNVLQNSGSYTDTSLQVIQTGSGNQSFAITPNPLGTGLSLSSYSGGAATTTETTTLNTTGLSNTNQTWTATITTNYDGNNYHAVAITANIYKAATLSIGNTSGGLTLTSASGSGNIANASITIASSNVQSGWTIASNFTASPTGSATTVASFNDTGKLNGTYTGSVTLTGRTDASILGSAAGDLNSQLGTYNISHAVAGHAGIGTTYSADILAGGNLAGYSLASGTSDGGNGAALNTVATVLQGTASTATTLTMSFARRADLSAHDQSLLQSDALNLSGVTGLYVLQMSYDPSLNAIDPAWIDYLDPTSGHWVNAVTGNSDGGASAQWFVNQAYNASTDFHLGYYGYDIATHTAWAVLDHNSTFAVVPEPADYFVLATAGLVATGYRRKRA